ncbi:MAG: alpha/beta hydrolase [Bacteroidales bacterium]
MTKYKEFYWKSSDGLDLFVCLWEPEEKPLAVINMVHGLGEHSGRYVQWAANFVKEGYAFLAFDYRGHGKSQGKRGHVENYGKLLDDIDIMLVGSRRLFPDIPSILYGHSLGGNLVINYVQKGSDKPDALIVTSPFLKHSKEPPALTRLAGKLILRIWPSFTMGNGLHSTDLSHNAEVSGLYKNDPLVHNQISPSLYFGMREAGEKALNSSAGIGIPILLMHGSGDKITSWKASAEFAGKYNENTTFRLWDGLFHELHNEPSAGEIFAFTLHWLKNLPSENKKTDGYF